MNEIDRREFIKLAGIGGVSLATMGCSRPLTSLEAAITAPVEEYDIGQCKSLRIKCISELGWFDGKLLMENIRASGGPKASQWTVDWDPNNGAGSSSLIDMETLDGAHHKFLIDAGWSNPYMEECFKREGIDKMLKHGEIEFLFVTHEHFDHLWGLETVLKYNPEIKVLVPDTLYDEGYHFLKGAEFLRSKARNSIPHRGELVRLEPGEVNRLYPGCAAVAFDLPILLRVRGEASLYFNVKDRGMVCVTGCCHQSILALAEFARKKIAGGDNMYGVYGGLHIAPFGPISPKREHIIKGMADYNFRKVACNHCTGLVAVRRMIELGYPVVRGTARHGSVSDLYVGSGDEVVFG